MKRFEVWFETWLWRSRFMLLPGVLASLAVAAGACYLATVDALHLIGRIAGYGSSSLTREGRYELRTEVVTGIVNAVDGYLIAAILVIFALGLYELFVNRLEPVDAADVGPRLLRVHDVDDLKDRIARLILLVIIIEFFGHALRLDYRTALDLLYLALGILLVGGALFLGSLKFPRREDSGLAPPAVGQASAARMAGSVATIATPLEERLPLAEAASVPPTESHGKSAAA